MYLCGHLAALAIDHPQRQSLARLEVGQTRLAQHFYMQKDIIIFTKDIGKAEPFGFIEPLYPRRFNRCRSHNRGIDPDNFIQCNRLAGLRRMYGVNLRRLNAAACFMRAQFDPRTIGDRTLTVISQNVYVQQNICAALIGNNESKPL